MTMSNEAVEKAAMTFPGYTSESEADDLEREINAACRSTARRILEAAAGIIRAEALEEAAEALGLPGSSASGYYASEQIIGYREAERHVEADLRARAAAERGEG